MPQRIRSLVESDAFNRAILFVILLNAVLVGLETSPQIMERYASVISTLSIAILAVFVAEILLRIAAYGFRVHRFFRNGWNVFDFSVIAISLLPGTGSVAIVARLARVMRELPLISYSEDLRMTVNAMLRSIPSLGILGVLITALLYVYAVFGVYLFGSADPARWGDLGSAMLTCFSMLTLDGWVQMENAVIGNHPYAWIFFASFVLIGVFVLVNVFVAMVIKNLEDVRKETAPIEDEILGQIADLRDQLERYERRLQSRSPKAP